MLSDYVEKLDVRGLSREIGLHLAGTIVPALLRKVAESGCTIQVEEGSEALEDFHSRRTDGHLYPLLVRDRWALDQGDAVGLFLVEGGEIIGCIGASLLWVERSLAAYLEAFGSSATALDAVERIASCHVVYIGGGYILGGKRGKRVYGEMYDLLLILALTRWRWSWAFTLFRAVNPLNPRWDPLSLAAKTCRFESVQPYVDVKGAHTYLATLRRRAAWRGILAE